MGCYLPMGREIYSLNSKILGAFLISSGTSLGFFTSSYSFFLDFLTLRAPPSSQFQQAHHLENVYHVEQLIYYILEGFLLTVLQQLFRQNSASVLDSVFNIVFC